jgi:probable rRNA maturation factor
MDTVEIISRSSAGRRLAPGCRRLLGKLLHATRRRRAGVTLLLAADPEVRRLNRRYRRKDRNTDVLSFPAGGELEPGRPHLGEIAISIPQAARQARRAGWSLREETSLLLVHGFLHLLGYDHERDDGAMRRKEEILLRRVAGVALDRRATPWGMPGRGRRLPRLAAGR